MEKCLQDPLCRYEIIHEGGFTTGIVILAILTALAAAGLVWLVGGGLLWIIATYCLTGSVALLALAWYHASHSPGDHACPCGSLEAEGPPCRTLARGRSR